MKNRAVTPGEKEAVLEVLRAAWLKCPELRLGQLLVNSGALSEMLFYLEDFDLAARVTRFAAPYPEPQGAPTGHLSALSKYSVEACGPCGDGEGDPGPSSQRRYESDHEQDPRGTPKPECDCGADSIGLHGGFHRTGCPAR